MSEQSFYTVGKIVNTQGLKGEVRVISTTDFAAERYKKGNELMFFAQDGSTKPVTIRSHRKHKNFDIVAFEGLNTIEDVESMRNGHLKIAHEHLSELPENEFYYHEIIGLDVYSTTGESLGKVAEILSPGANDVWVVKQKGRKDLLVPYIEPVVLAVDLAEKKVIIELIEGLVD